MKAISLWQPWASLMAYRFKTIETRHWPTSYRGPLIIHAAKRKMDIIHDEAVRNFESVNVDWLDGLPFGYLLCLVTLIDVSEIRNPDLYKYDYDSTEIAHGDFSLGRYAWVTNFVKRFENPIPFRGSQGFFNVPQDILSLKIDFKKENNQEVLPFK